MSLEWVKLGNLLKRSDEQIEVVPDTIYKQITVRLWGQGVTLRGEIAGIEIASPRQYLAKEGQFIVSRIDARNGAFGIVSSELHGAIVTNDFPLFDLNPEKIIPQFLGYLSKTQTFVELCSQASEGTTNRVRLKLDHFLDLEIPLPPLEEQKRIVAQIEAVATRLAEARGLRQGAVEEAEALLDSAMSTIWRYEEEWQGDLLGNLISISSGQIDPRIEPYANLPHINGENIESGTCRLLNNYRLAHEDGIISGKYHFRSNSILYSKIRPYLKKATQIPFEGICSADIYAIDSMSPDLAPRFLMYSLISPRFTEYANLLSGRTRMPKLNQNQLLGFNLTYPALVEQYEIVTYLDDLQARVESLKTLQTATAAELEALLPSLLDRAFKGDL